MIYIVCSKGDRFLTAQEQSDMSQHLLRTGMSGEHGIDVVNDDIIRNAWGKPFLKDHPDIYFNVSHCTGGVALSISSFRTGIDIEKVRSFSEITARKILADNELETIKNSKYPELDFFRFWTLKESYLKALGIGISYPLNKINFTIDQNSNITTDLKGCMFGLFENERNFVAAVCYLNRNDRLKETLIYRLLP
ncbi:MAG: 4'-phosphopantetheinyl transferase superfamily protein [Eubacteriales bacterium]